MHGFFFKMCAFGNLTSIQPRHSDAKNDRLDRIDAVVTHCHIPREDVHEFFFQKGDAICPTHVLASDESTKSLVIAVRGTMSIADALSDLQATSQHLDAIGTSTKIHRHIRFSRQT